MNTQLQQLIEELKQEKEKAIDGFHNSRIGTYQEAYDFGKSHAFSFAISAVEKILNEGSVAAPSAEKKEYYNCEYKSDNEDNRAAISA